MARQAGLGVEVARFEDWAGAGREVQRRHRRAGLALGGSGGRCGERRARAAARRPAGGVLERGAAAAELAAASAEVYRAVQPGLPFDPWTRPIVEAYQVMCRRGRRRHQGSRVASASQKQWRFDSDRPYTRDEWLDQVPTMGGHAQLHGQARKRLLAGLRAAIDALGGGFTMNYATVAVTAARTP